MSLSFKLTLLHYFVILGLGTLRTTFCFDSLIPVSLWQEWSLQVTTRLKEEEEETCCLSSWASAIFLQWQLSFGNVTLFPWIYWTCFAVFPALTEPASSLASETWYNNPTLKGLSFSQIFPFVCPALRAKAASCICYHLYFSVSSLPFHIFKS